MNRADIGIALSGLQDRLIDSDLERSAFVNLQCGKDGHLFVDYVRAQPHSLYVPAKEVRCVPKDYLQRTYEVPLQQVDYSAFLRMIGETVIGCTYEMCRDCYYAKDGFYCREYRLARDVMRFFKGVRNG